MGAVVITFDDIPKVRYNERIITIPSVLHKDHYVLADKVRRMGEAVAAVAAETEELAEKAVRAIQVEYEVLPVLIDPIEAMQPGAEPIYDTVLWGEKEIEIENNIACEREVEEGDVDRAFAEADVDRRGHLSGRPRSTTRRWRPSRWSAVRSRMAASPSGPPPSRSTTCASFWARSLTSR